MFSIKNRNKALGQTFPNLQQRLPAVWNTPQQAKRGIFQVFLWPLAVTRWANETENGDLTNKNRDLMGCIADL